MRVSEAGVGIAGQPVTFYYQDDSGYSITQAVVTTNASGFAALPWTPLQEAAGFKAKIVAYFWGGAAERTFELTVNPVYIHLVSGNDQRVAVFAGALPLAMKVKVTQGASVDSAPVAGWKVKVAGSTGNGAGNLSAYTSGYTDSSGFYSLSNAQLLSSKAPGEWFSYLFQASGATGDTRFAVRFSHRFTKFLLEKVSGDEQVAEAGLPAREPLVVKLLDDSGAGVANRTISFAESNEQQYVFTQNVVAGSDGIASYLPRFNSRSTAYVIKAVSADMPDQPIKFQIYICRVAPQVLSITGLRHWYRADYGLDVKGNVWYDAMNAERLAPVSGGTFASRRRPIGERRLDQRPPDRQPRDGGRASFPSHDLCRRQTRDRLRHVWRPCTAHRRLQSQANRPRGGLDGRRLGRRACRSGMVRARLFASFDFRQLWGRAADCVSGRKARFDLE
jgi:hypothetical protein